MVHTASSYLFLFVHPLTNEVSLHTQASKNPLLTLEEITEAKYTHVVVAEVHARASPNCTAYGMALKTIHEQYDASTYDSVKIEAEILRRDRSYTVGELRKKEGLIISKGPRFKL